MPLAPMAHPLMPRLSAVAPPPVPQSWSATRMQVAASRPVRVVRAARRVATEATAMELSRSAFPEKRGRLVQTTAYVSKVV